MEMKGKKGWKIGGLIILGVGLVILIVLGVKSGNNNDFKMAIVGDNGIMIRSVSWQRGMVNELWVDGGVEVWVPGGMGWYQSDKIGKLLNQEKKTYLANEVMFYNFGFVPDIVVWGNDDNWLSNAAVIKKWGIANYLKFLAVKPRMMVKQETINTNLTAEQDFLNEVIQRDFADSRLLGEDLRLTVYNVGQSQGLANFMARILEWSGFEVVGVDNYAGEIKDDCLVNYGQAAETSYGLKILKKEFGNCQFQKDEELDPMTVELYFGDSYSQMLNYQSYNQ
jgi:hypothetical protein